jgi:cytidylate kinase
MGDLRGKMAQERGMTIDEFNKLGETEAFTDKDADEYQKKLGETEDNFVIDGRLSWHFIPQSFKVFLTADTHIAAERILNDRKTNPNRADEPEYESVDQVEKAITDRLKSDQTRYKKWYGIDFLDKANYDLVIDTTHIPASETLGKVLDAVQKLR